MKSLTGREIEVIKLLSEGLTTNEVASELQITSGTVRSHRKNIFLKSKCKNTTQLVAKCIRKGLI